ncbi:MAG: gephyrin-like molybdotransferase Glp [Pseudomonadota bacterium]
MSTDNQLDGCEAAKSGQASAHQAPFLSVEQARAFLLDAAVAFPLPVEDRTACEIVPTMEANGRVLAVSQVSSLDVPPLDNSQMDGYAVIAADCVDGRARLQLAQRIAAGQVGMALKPGTAARIFTGAAIPPGADAVVMQEVCEVEHSPNGNQVTVRHTPKVGDWIRRAGEDIRTGTEILSAGMRLDPPALGLAASVGLAVLPVVRRLRVAVFFTGDELAMPGETLKPGAIYNSNRFMLRGLLENLGCFVTDFGTIPDTLAATRETLREAACEHDLVIACGGVSVGEEDHVKPAVEAEGSLNMWRIAAKPGKPLVFGTLRRRVAAGANNAADATAFFFGLPGNPVSSLIAFMLFVRPFMLRMQGVQDVLPKSFAMRADFSWPKAGRRREFLRAKVNDVGGLDLFTNQGSGVLTSAVWGDGIIDNPADMTIAPGAMVQFIPFSSLLH